MPKALRQFYNVELRAYKNSLREGKLKSAWRSLERAHVIGQAYPYEHTYVHWRMLQFGVMIKKPREVIGQIPRLLIGGVKSFVGKIPVGNTGGSDIPPLKSLPIEKDILEIFQEAGVGPPTDNSLFR
jgi:hypothetical protein